MAPTPVPSLIVHQGANPGRSVPLSKDRLTIGRSEHADLPFPDTKLSREHAEFIRRDGAWRIRDLASRNGTFLNGRKLGDEAVALTVGDRITLGLVELEFVTSAQASAQPAPAAEVPSPAVAGAATQLAMPAFTGSRLRVLTGALAGRDFALGERTVFGRAAGDADISLEDSAASRRNTEITRDGPLWQVRDLGSRNGTELDGERLPADQPIRMHAGARLRIGATFLEFVDQRVDLPPGHQVHGWTLVERIGAGAAGVVYRVRGADGSEAALKLLDPGRNADPRESLRFLNSARAQGRVTHPHVARVPSAELIAGQALAFSELAAQGSLAAALSAGTGQPATRVLPWLRDAAHALQAAEERGLVHRGLRPGNLLLDAEGAVVVGDFGTCAYYDRAQPQAGPATNWIAPEEATGAEPDARANQFSLGCIAWQALTGALPFAASERAASALARQDQVLPPPAVAHDLLKVLARLLARAPENRYPGWAEAAADLDALVRGVAPTTAPLAPGLSALGQAGGARASVRVAVPPLLAADATTPLPLPRVERMTLPPMAIKGLFALAVVILVAGFIVPALNRSATQQAQAAKPTTEAVHTGTGATRVESPSEMIDRMAMEEARRKVARFERDTGTAAVDTAAAAVEAMPEEVQPEPASPAPPATEATPSVAQDPATSATIPAAPAGQDAVTADFRFRSHRFTEAIVLYRKALELNPGHPELVARLADSERLQAIIDAALAQVPKAIAAGDHATVLEQLAIYIDTAKPARLDAAWKAGFEAAWAARVGHATVDQRTQWQAAGKAVGIPLRYDPQAPALLAEAVQAARAGAVAGQQIALFAKAAKANAGFGDDENLLYAAALAAGGQPGPAAERVKRLSAEARKRPEAEALALTLGLGAPVLDPQVVAQFAIGGAGDQYIREVGFAGGMAWAKGAGFSVQIDPRSGKCTVQGNPAIADPEEWNAKFARSPKANVQVKDPRNDQTYSITTLQVHPVLQQPLLTSSAGWKLWGWSHEQITLGTKGVRWGPLMADSRGYDVWLMPEGHIGVLCWTDGGNSVLTRDPRDLQKANDAVEQGGSFRANAGGMSTLFMLVDASTGTPLSGTFLRSHVTNRVVDAYGRVYLPKPFEGASALGGAANDAGGGLFVLRPDLRQPELNVRLGAGALEGGKEGFAVLALSDNLLILGGTSNNPALPAPAGSTRGSGQDGFITVLRLWDKP